MTETVCYHIIDKWSEWTIGLPALTALKSKNRLVRLVCIPWHFIWFLPAGLLWFPVFFICMIGMMFEDAWKGNRE